MRTLYPLSFALMATGTLAQVSSDGHSYNVTCNDHGYVLRSKWPVSRFVGTGAATVIETGEEVIYFGKDCDAFSEHLGTGTWCWANGGFVADLEHRRIGFPRQELYCPAEPNFETGFECGC